MNPITNKILDKQLDKINASEKTKTVIRKLVKDKISDFFKQDNIENNIGLAMASQALDVEALLADQILSADRSKHKISRCNRCISKSHNKQ